MSEEIMITVKQADGTMKQVPLSSVTKNPKIDTIPKEVETVEVPVAEPVATPEPPVEVPPETPAEAPSQTTSEPVVAPLISEPAVVAPAPEVTHDIVPSDIHPPATTKPNTHVFDKESATETEPTPSPERSEVKIQEPVFSESPKKKRRKRKRKSKSATNTDIVPTLAKTPAVSVPNEHVFEHDEAATEPTKADMPAPESPKEAMANTLRQHAAADAVWTPKDAMSPLEENIEGAKIVPNKIIVQIPDEVQAVLTKHEVTLDERLQKRLSGLIDTAVRHVRTPAQFVDALKKEVARGGMGFETAVAEGVLEVLHIVTKSVEESAPKLPVEPAAIPKQEAPVVPAAPTPIPPLPTTSKKVPMTDISMPKGASTGTMDPIEELAAMTLDDFRRLGGRGSIGLEEVKKKFEVLLKESVTVYLRGVKAWHQSPLFLAYANIISSSINSNVPIASLLTGGETFTPEEWQAIGEVQKEIRL